MTDQEAPVADAEQPETPESAAEPPTEEETEQARALSFSASITHPARHSFDKGQAAAIKASVAKDCNDAEFAMFLELAARYKLDPFAKQLWAVKMKDRVVIMVSADGLLAIANRHDDFEGITGDVVHENDEFGVDWAGNSPGVNHSYTKHLDRGKIIGAWAICRRAGREPTFFFAPMDEYNGKKNAWTQYPSAMIQKCANSVALRRAFSISGLVAEEEMDASRRNLTARPAEPEFGEDALGAWLRDLTEVARRLDQNAYRDAKLRALLTDADDDRRRGLAEEVAKFIADAGGAVPEEPIDAEVEVEVEVVD